MQGEWLREPKGTTSVVFVHGILSSGDACWLNNNGTYWPELLTNEEEFLDTGIYIYSYETGYFSGNYSLNDVVDDLKERSINLDGIFDSKQVIFVCHSMGGIVVRKFIVERISDLLERKTKIGLFLVASPSLGSSYANFLGSLAKVVGNTQADVLRFEQNNIWLNGLDKEFQNLKSSGKIKIIGKELVEDKFFTFKNFWSKQVVEPFSGARYFGESFKVPNSDHFSIAKPEDKESIQHRLLCKFLKDFLKVNLKYNNVEKKSNHEIESKNLELGSNTSLFKYYIYISDSKINMLFSQISKDYVKKVSLELNIDSQNFSDVEIDNKLNKLNIIVNYLTKLNIVGTIDEPKDYFSGELLMQWGPFYDPFLSNDSSLIYFGGETENTVVGLGGSAKNVLGNVGTSAPHSHSTMPAILTVLRKENNSDANEELHDESLAAVHLATKGMKGPTQRLEFIAKRLAVGPSPYPHRDKKQGMRVLLGTPLYIAMLE